MARDDDGTVRRLVLMPDVGNELIWSSYSVRQQGVGYACCNIQYTCGDHPLSDLLWSDMKVWARMAPEEEPFVTAEMRDFPWDAFHHRGTELARRLKQEVGSKIRVLYVKTSADPDFDCEGWHEILGNGEVCIYLPPPHVPSHLPFDIADEIVSGGQTGVDRAALDFAVAHGIPHGGWCPKGRRADYGPIPPHYRLTETESEGYRQRTKRNVADSDATLILNLGELDGGSLQTLRFADRMRKPARVVQLDRDSLDVEAEITRHWLVENAVSVLNIAGPKESKRAGIYQKANDFLLALAGNGT